MLLSASLPIVGKINTLLSTTATGLEKPNGMALELSILPDISGTSCKNDEPLIPSGFLTVVSIKNLPLPPSGTFGVSFLQPVITTAAIQAAKNIFLHILLD